jgi:hypothetical protein
MGWSPGGKTYAEVIAKAVAGATMAALQQKGNGNGKGKGGGKGRGVSHRSEQTSAQPARVATKWRCQWKDCDSNKAHSRTFGQANFADKAECHWCDRPKHRALNPPKAMAARGNGSIAVDKCSDKVGDGGLKASEAWKRIETSLPELPKIGDPGDAEQGKRSPPRLPAELSVNELKPALEEVAHSLASEIMPSVAALPSAEETFAQALKNVQSCNSEEEILRLEARRKATMAAHAVVPPDSAARAAIDKDIVDLDASIARLRKKGSTTATSRRLALEQARGSYLAEFSRKKDIASKGAANALERSTQRRTQLQLLKSQLEDFAAAMVAFEAEVSNAHQERLSMREKLAQDVIALFDQRIADATPLAPSTAQTDTRSTDVHGGVPQEGSSNTRSGVDHGVSDVNAHVEALEKQLQKFRELAKQTVAFEAIVKDAPDPTNAELPAVEDVDLAPRAEALHHFLVRWTTDGSKLPVTVAEMASASRTEDGEHLLVAILGNVFAKFFPEGVQPQTVLPKQVAAYMAAVLARVVEKFQAPVAAKAKADESFSDIAAKRARVE